MEKVPLTTDHKLNLSPTALHKVLLLPIVAMVLTINIVFGVSWYIERRSQEDALADHVVTALNGHSTYLSREIFFDRASAVSGRLSEIVKSKAWNPDSLPARLCLYLVFDPSFNKRSAESLCSDDVSDMLPNSLATLPRVTLEVGERHAADLYYDVSLKAGAGSFIPPNLLLPMILGIVAAALSYLMLFRRLNINLIQPAHERIVKNEKLAAIAKFVQMIAHDIRGPFSLFRTIIKDLDDSEIKASAKSELLRVVDKELGQVNNMLADVMAIGPVNPKTDSVSPTEMIAVALCKVSSLRQKSGVTFSYKLQHTKKVAVEELKTLRILGNIIDNAMQAVDDHGTIRIETRDTGTHGYTEFHISNTGSYVAADDREKIFEAFFTKNKAGGTGLGLASAKTIVDAYGGKIWCTSDAGKGTSLFFTLPTHQTIDDQAQASLPKTSDEAAKGKFHTKEVTASTTIKVPERPLNILLVDDQSVYSQSLATMMGSYEPLNGKLQIRSSQSVAEANEAVNAFAPDIIVTDLDFGPHQPDGFGLIREMSSRFPNAVIAAYTNRSDDDCRRAVANAGASVLITKPINDTSLVSLLNEAIAKIPETGEPKTQVVFVDDKLAFFKHWSRNLRGVQFHYFSSPEHLWDRLRSDPTFVQRVDLVLTDFKFDSLSKENGNHVAQRIRSLCDKPVYLISNYLDDELNDRLDRSLFTGIFDKDDVPSEDEFRKRTQLA